ncbi:hypothetical protein, partial [Pseudomonas sp. NPDC089741]|uniref:hypothetical protein n=1 Tax=Pseudomonas sp. NPDC089741 TaxID=3364470 RepID=UPI003805DA8E
MRTFNFASLLFSQNRRQKTAIPLIHKGAAFVGTFLDNSQAPTGRFRPGHPKFIRKESTPWQH